MSVESSSPSSSSTIFPGEPRISREVRGHVLLIGLDRARKKNAFDLQMLHEMSEAYTELDGNPELRAGVVFAHGSDFTSGLDLASVAPVVAQGRWVLPEGAIDPWATHGPACRKPIIAAAHGLCLTIGIETLLAADIRLAATGTRFAQIEIKRGIFPFGGATARFVTTAGWGNAMRYLLTGDEFGAEEALRIGIVQEVMPQEQLFGRALELAERVADQAPLGVQETLRSSRRVWAAAEQAAAKELMPALREVMNTDDAREGLASFLERRKAIFTGR